MKTCCSADCPKTDSKIIGQLCEWWYPYGSKTKCGKMFERWLKEDKEVQKIHSDFLNNRKE